MKKTYFHSLAQASEYFQEDVADASVLKRSQGNWMNSRTFNDWDTNISVRSDYNRRDYDMFRPSEREARTYREILCQSQIAYKKVGLIRNVIDTMGDFGSQGARLQHSDDRVNQFYETWWAKVQGTERSERFLNLLYRHGTVIIKKAKATIPVTMEKQWKKSIGEKAGKLKESKVESRVIPIRYTFLNPLSVEAVGGAAALFVEKPRLVLKLTNTITAYIGGLDRMPSGGNYGSSKTIDKLPPELKDQVKNGNTIELDPETIETFYYKKDDWELWGSPMIDSVLDDIIMLLKMKQADVAALDGAISNIRLWTLGKIGTDAQTTFFPTRYQINKLRNVLANNVGGGVIDLVWGPDLDFKESQSQVWRWLGSEKYQAVLSAIYEGLGVPPSLRGGGGSGGASNTGNFVGLNTMVKRLEYGRDLLSSFWQKELNEIHKAMGFAGSPPELVFDYMILADEAAEKQLLIQLWDRDIIPSETILEIFNRLPTVEFARLKREMEKRGKDMPNKASPYHNAEKEHDYNKAMLGGGQVAPSELGIELKPKKDGEKTKIEMMTKMAKETKKLQQPSGRPANVTETKKRKAKPIGKPRTKASNINTLLWTSNAQSLIHEIVNPALLIAVNKSNARQLTIDEANKVEYIKFAILSNLDPMIDLTEAIVIDALSQNTPIHTDIQAIANECIQEFTKVYKREPKIDELRQIYIGSYAFFYNSNDN